MLRVILVAVLAAIVLMALWAATRTRDAPLDTPANGDSTPASPRPMSPTTSRHTEALAAAREELQHAEAAHARAVQGAEDRFIEAGRDVDVISVAGWRLGQLSLTIGDRQRWLTEGTQAHVEDTSESQVHLVVEADDWQEECTLPPDHLQQAQRFVAATVSIVSTLPQSYADRQQRIEVARAELEAVRADTEQLDLARMTVEDLEGAGPLRRDLPPAPDDTTTDDD